jgi:hypothetical protein
MLTNQQDGDNNDSFYKYRTATSHCANLDCHVRPAPRVSLLPFPLRLFEAFDSEENILTSLKNSYNDFCIY